LSKYIDAAFPLVSFSLIVLDEVESYRGNLLKNHIISLLTKRYLTLAIRIQWASITVALIAAVGLISHALAEPGAVISGNPFLPNSTSNPFSLYNNSFYPDSPRNRFGRFGNAFSPYSANNPFATNGLIPRLIENPKNSCAEVFLGFDLAV
jgi:hypothetical protein